MASLVSVGRRMTRDRAVDGFAEVVEKNVLLSVSGGSRWLHVCIDLAVHVDMGQGSFLSYQKYIL